MRLTTATERLLADTRTEADIALDVAVDELLAVLGLDEEEEQ